MNLKNGDVPYSSAARMPSPILSPWALGKILSRKGWGLGSLHPLTHSSSGGSGIEVMPATGSFFPISSRVPAASVVMACRCLFKSGTEVSGELVSKAHSWHR